MHQSVHLCGMCVCVCMQNVVAMTNKDDASHSDRKTVKLNTARPTGPAVYAEYQKYAIQKKMLNVQNTGNDGIN